MRSRRWIKGEHGYFAGSVSSGGKSAKKVDKSGKSGIIKVIENAVGKPVYIVEKTELYGEPDSITQVVKKKGGIDRNYYDSNGKQIKQVSNNDHGHKAESKLGEHGEHAHDYVLDENGVPKHGKARNLNDIERKENSDIL